MWQHKTRFTISFILAGFALVLMLLQITSAHAQSEEQDGATTSIFLPLIANDKSQPLPETLAPYHMQPFPLHSGVYDGAATGQSTVLAASFQQQIQVADAPWLRLFFGESNLGRESYVEIVSRKDGAQQRLYALDLALRENRSAFFNGDTLEVTLFTAPGDTGVFFQIQEIMVGEWSATIPDGQPAQQTFPILPGIEPADVESICTPNDDRIATTDNAVGRVMPVGCTAWIVSTGVYLTAGHCVGPNFQELQFHVPGSTANGNPQPPATEHQYAIVQTSIRSRSGGIGNDWAVFAVQPQLDTSTGKRRLPPEAQQSFYRMSQDSNPTTIRVTGYGVDGPAPCYGSSNQPGCTGTITRNNDSQTLQTHLGASQGETVNNSVTSFWSYQVDTQGGNSGSPIIFDGQPTLLTVGIHTAGANDATCTTNFNQGTSFENDDLEQAIAEFYDNDFVYIDAGHPIASSLEAGTVFRPFKRINDGINRAPTGGTLSIVKGTYNASVTINRSMILTAPVGTVTIVGQ